MNQAFVRAPGRLLSWAALTVALVYSIAANVAYAHPQAGPRLASGAAPVLVILAAGLMERVSMSGVQWWRRVLALAGLAVVIGAAFVTSFEHQYALLVRYGDSRLSSALLPIAVDGLIVLASVCLTVIAERQRAAQSALKPPAAQVSRSVRCPDPEESHAAQPAPLFAPEPAARPTDDAAQEPAPRPAHARSVARPHAPRNAQPKDPRMAEVLRLYAQHGSAPKVREAMNGAAPPLRTIQLWISQARNAQQKGSDA